MQGMSVVVRPKGWNCEAGRARRRFCSSRVQVNFELNVAVSSSGSINGSSSSVDGDSNFVHFCGEFHEGVEFTRGADVAGQAACWAK